MQNPALYEKNEDWMQITQKSSQKKARKFLLPTQDGYRGPEAKPTNTSPPVTQKKKLELSTDSGKSSRMKATTKPA